MPSGSSMASSNFSSSINLTSHSVISLSSDVLPAILSSNTEFQASLFSLCCALKRFSMCSRRCFERHVSRPVSEHILFESSERQWFRGVAQCDHRPQPWQEVPQNVHFHCQRFSG